MLREPYFIAAQDPSEPHERNKVEKAEAVRLKRA